RPNHRSGRGRNAPPPQLGSFPDEDGADRRQRAASRPRRVQSGRRESLHAEGRERGLRRQEPCRTAADDLWGARRAHGQSSPRLVDPRNRSRRMIMATIESSILETITPVTHDLGAFKVNRTLPAKQRTMVGPFIFVDEFGPARLPAGQGMDVRPHPHINLATVTYLFEGAIQHRDSIGSNAVIEPGAINLMTAGSGIVHSERSPQALRPEGPSLYGMQTWIALPDGHEEVEPAFDHVPGSELPLVEAAGVHARVLMGTLWGATAPTRSDSPTIYADIELTGGSIPIDAEADERAVMLVGGGAELDGRPLDLFTL